MSAPHDTSYTAAALDQHVRAGAERMVEALHAISDDAGVVEMVLADYLEEVSKRVVGRQGVHAFLLCIARQLDSTAEYMHRD